MVKVKSFLNGLGNDDAKFVGPIKIACLMLFGHSDNLFTLLKDVRNPPVKCRLVSDIHCLGIFGNLDGVSLF